MADFYFFFLQESSDASVEAKHAEYPQPVVLIRGQAVTLSVQK